jgi:hypothetical protein
VGGELGCGLGDTDFAGPPGFTLDDVPGELVPEAQAATSAASATPPQVAAALAASRLARVIPMTMLPALTESERYKHV